MADVKLIPLEVLLGNPERAAAQISPDGKRLSYMAPLDGVMNVFVGDAGAGNERPVTHDANRGIQGYVWAHDNRHIMYVRDKDGSENFRLYDVDLETGVERDLTPLDDVQCRLVAHRKDFPNDVLIGLNRTTLRCTTCTIWTWPPQSWRRSSRTPAFSPGWSTPNSKSAAPLRRHPTVAR